MQHALLMRMLHGPTNPDRQFEACGDTQAVAVAVVGDGLAGHQFHHHIRPTALSGTRVENLGDAGMIHHGHGLTFALETGNHGATIHARLQNFNRHATPNRIGLLGRENPSHPALTQELEQAIATDDRSGLFLLGRVRGPAREGLEERIGVSMRFKKRLHLVAKRRVRTGLVQKRGLRGR